MNRVNIKQILRDPTKVRQLVAGAIRFCAAHEGRDLTVQESLDAYDRSKRKSTKPT